MANLPPSVRSVELIVFGIADHPSGMFFEIIGAFSWRYMFTMANQLSQLQTFDLIVTGPYLATFMDAWKDADAYCTPTKEMILQITQGMYINLSNNKLNS